MENIRIAAVQMRSIVGQTSENLHTLKRMTTKAAHLGAEIVCFPELSICGYNTAEKNGNGESKGELPNVENVPSPSGKILNEISRETGVWILAGLLEREKSGIIYNTQLVVTPKGLLGSYRKTHVPTTEIGTWSPGNNLPVFDHPKIRFGIEICYDSHFPEVSTALATAGAELIFLPHASGGLETGQEKHDRWVRYIPARAYDNSLYVSVCNQVGNNGYGQQFQGISFICSPLGNIISESESFSDESIIVADLKSQEFENARKVPETFFRHFSRPELYEKWDRANIDSRNQ